MHSCAHLIIRDFSLKFDCFEQIFCSIRRNISSLFGTCFLAFLMLLIGREDRTTTIEEHRRSPDCNLTAISLQYLLTIFPRKKGRSFQDRMTKRRADSEYFSSIKKIEFDPSGKNPLSFKYYNPEQLVLGKKMKDW